MKLALALILAFLVAVCVAEIVSSDIKTSAHIDDIAACPNNCNGQGTCNGNTCRCNPGWGGDDCSIFIRTLTSGQPVHSSLTVWQWDYWRFNAPSGTRQPLLITVDEDPGMRGLDCDMYIKHNALPSHSNYDWRDISLNGHMEQNITNPSGEYFIGIFAFLNCNYTIKASLGNICPNNCNNRGVCTPQGQCQCTGPWTGPSCNEAIPTLSLNAAVSSQVALGAWKFFRIALAQTYSLLSIQLSHAAGSSGTDLDIYVKRGQAPTFLQYDYANGSLSENSHVNIADAAAGDWYVGIYGYGCTQPTCPFRIQAVVTDRCPNRCSLRGFCRGTSCACSTGYTGNYCETQSALMNLGQVYEGFVESFAWNYFQFRVVSNNPVLITVRDNTIHDGDCDIYVRRDQKPTTFYYDYKENSDATNVTLTVPSPGDAFWWVGMYGYKTCDYTIKITAMTDTHCEHGGVPSGGGGTCQCPAGWGGDRCEVAVARITQGINPNDRVSSGQFKYYNFSLPETPTDLVVYLHETGTNSKGNVWLFLNQQFIPTIRDHAFEDVDTNTQYHMIKVTRDQLPQRRSGPQNFIIGVYGSPYLISGTAAYQLAVWAPPFP